MTARPRAAWLVAGAFAVVCAVWGTTPFSIKAGLRAGWEPLWFCAIRLLLAAAVLAPVLLTRAAGAPLGRRGRLLVLPMGLFGIALNFGLTVWGQQYIGAGLASLLVGTQPITTTLIARWTTRQPITARFAASLVVGMLGVVAMFGGGEVSGSRAVLGALAVFTGVTVYGAIFVYISAHIGSLNTIRVVCTQNLIGGVLVAAAAAVAEGVPRVPRDAGAVVALGYLVLASSIVALVLAVWLIGRMGAARFSLMSFLTPTVGVAAGVVWLHERLDAGMVVGAVLVMVALALALRRPAGAGPGPGDRVAAGGPAAGPAGSGGRVGAPVSSAPRPGRARWPARPPAAAAGTADAAPRR